MKTFSLIFSLVIFYTINTASAAQIKVKLSDIPSKGTVILSLFDNAQSFNDLRDTFKQVKFPINKDNTYIIKDLPKDNYALMVFLDENNNNFLDRNFIGIPNEPVGFSNNYNPKGPPNYLKASFLIEKNESKNIKIKLRRPLGEFGSIGLGLSLIGTSSPYRDYNSNIYKIFPSITYTGSKFQFFGPFFQYGLLGADKIRLAVTGSYRFKSYDKNKSSFFEGMIERSDTFMIGLSLKSEFANNYDLSTSFKFDVLDRIGGWIGKFQINKSFQYKSLKSSIDIGLNLLSSQISNHDFGVKLIEKKSNRPQYLLGQSLNIETGANIFIELKKDWFFMVKISSEFFEDSIRNSPLVEKNYIIKTFLFLNYAF